jgi:transposase
MWKDANRTRYDRRGLRYSSDLTDEEGVLIRPLIPPAKHGGNQRALDVRAVVNGEIYVLSTDCKWAAVPTNLPPRSTVNDYFRRYDCDGTLMRIHHALHVQCREAAGSDVSATATTIDSKSVKGAEQGGARPIRRATMAAIGSEVRNGTSSSTRTAC